jgi:hypothetical protein
VLVDKRPVGRKVQEGVVDRAAAQLALLDADRQPDAVLARDRAEPVGRRAGYRDGVLGE